MQRVVVLGPGGAGKTELADAISRRTGLPVVYLDRIFWRENWTPAPLDEARRRLDAVIAGERWIIDGNFLDAGDARFARADTVVFLDLARRTCLRRVLWRLVRDRRRRRADLPEGSREGFDPELLRWIWRYRKADRPRVLTLVAGLHGADVRRLHSPREVRAYLESLGARPSG
jgi:adenylate kinase family enzyme